VRLTFPWDRYWTPPGYPAPFALSFLAATLLPLGSEWFLITMLVNRYDPCAVVAVASAGNTLGVCTTGAIGLAGGPFLIRRVLRIGAAAEDKARRIYLRDGTWSPLFSWLPFIGDPLCLAAGILRVRIGRLILLVSTGKLARYAVVAWMTLGAMRLLSG
jgi:membrane protein YqaA with SNARE-associated domain